jgi:hypothetical protein
VASDLLHDWDGAQSNGRDRYELGTEDTVRSVSSGADALRSVVEDPPDVVLLDEVMVQLKTSSYIWRTILWRTRACSAVIRRCVVLRFAILQCGRWRAAVRFRAPCVALLSGKPRITKQFVTASYP